MRHASALGIDVIVTDHHLPEAELPPALAVLNPNRPDCSYPEKNLCGAGVAFKLIDALVRRLGWETARRERLLDSLLKLVAIATVADVVPLTGENRVIVKRGLEGLRDVKNPGLRALLEVSGFNRGRLAQRRPGGVSRGPAHQRRRPHGQRQRRDRNVPHRRPGAGPRTGRQASRPESGPPADRGRDRPRDLRAMRPATGHRTSMPRWCSPARAGIAGWWELSPAAWWSGSTVPCSCWGSRTAWRKAPGAASPRFICWKRWRRCRICLRSSEGIGRPRGLRLPRAAVEEFRERLRAYAVKLLTPADFERELSIDSEIACGRDYGSGTSPIYCVWRPSGTAILRRCLWFAMPRSRGRRRFEMRNMSSCVCVEREGGQSELKPGISRSAQMSFRRAPA